MAPRRLDADLRAVLEAGAGLPRMEDLDPEAARELYAGMLRQFAEVNLPAVRSVDRSVAGRTCDVPVRILGPEAATRPLPILVYLHGGGWVLGDLDGYEAVTRRIVEDVQCIVISVGYRRAPEHRFPAAVEDCLDAFRWAKEHAEALGGDRARVAVGGDSAGGNLAAAISHLTRHDAEARPCLQLLLYPVLQLTSTDTGSYDRYADGYLLTRGMMRWFIRHYCPSHTDRQDPRGSPLLADHHAGLPPTLLTGAGFDVLQDEGLSYRDKLEDAGVCVRYRMFDSMTHGYFSMGGTVAGARSAIDTTLRDLRDAFAAVSAQPEE